MKFTLVAACIVAPFFGATAQRAANIPRTTVIDSMRADGSTVTVPLRVGPAAFDLLAVDDQACATYRSTGQLSGGGTNFRGPVPINQGGGCVAAQIYGNRTGYVFFEMGLAFATPPHELRKIRHYHLLANQHAGSWGYNANWQFVTSTPNRTAIDAADGHFGRTFSGLQSAENAGCRDDRDFFRLGAALLAMLDCPETWGSEGFQGKLRVPDSVFRKRFESNPAAFNWDEFRIPTQQLDPAAFLGSQSWYGYMSDYSREIRLRYGYVVPGGVGAPTEVGYPLGLDMRVDGWQFANSVNRHTQFYQVTLVNSSQKLYGAPIDYDSLYFGLTPGLLFGASNSHALYFDLPRNSVHVVRQGTSGRCSNTYPRRHPLVSLGCMGTVGFSSAGIYSITWLKSPLGDVRNKHFSNPASSYFSPNHPLAADTINFNRAQYGTFGNNALSAGTTRQAFGAMAKVEAHFLDGRTPAQLGTTTFIRTFTPETPMSAFPGADEARFPKFVPSTTINPATGQLFGKWDYNHDGVPDTISVPGCGSQGCHALWSDTNAGGFAQSWGNVHNTLSAGPFALRANEATQFLWAFTWSPDTLELNRRIAALLDGYMGNWDGPAPIAFPAVSPGSTYDIQSAELRDSLTAGSANSAGGARITLRLPNIDPIDRYFLREIARIRADSAANVGRTRQLLRLNPGLLQRLEARARDNLSTVYVFKSCDGGTTWTTTSGVSATCVTAETRNSDAAKLAFAWRPWAMVSYVNGVPATGTLNDDVMGGRNYMYSFVTRTRGFADFVLIDSAATGYITTNVQDAFSMARDTVNAALVAYGGNTVDIYAPLSAPAGRVFARVDTATLGGNATQDLQFTNVGAGINGTTRLVFANRLIVRRVVDTATNAAATTVSAQYLLPEAVVHPADPVVSNFVARSQTFTVAATIPVRSGSSLLGGTLRGVQGTARVYVDTLLSDAGTVGYVWVDAGNRPIYATANQYAPAFERDQQASPLYPGFTVRARDSANAATGFAQEFLTGTGTLRDRHHVIRRDGDTLQAAARQFAVNVQPILGSVKRVRGGTYVLTWLSDPWGPGAPFTIDPVSSIQQNVDASLTAVAASATTMSRTDEWIAQQVGASAQRPLVRVRIPFTMQFIDAETGETHPVDFAMRARSTPAFNTRLLGAGSDTVRVIIPDSLWMPGDTLFAIHPVRRDSTIRSGTARAAVVAMEAVNGVSGFRPIQVVTDTVALAGLWIACNPSASSSGVRPTTFDLATCNPLVIRSRGATPNGGYLPVAAGWRETFTLTRTFDARSEVSLTALPFAVAAEPGRRSIQDVRVVPNPYVVRSDFDHMSGRNATPRIYFTGVPSRGVLRIYTVSGQWVQELSWTEQDLMYQGNVTASGDLPYNLRTHEGSELASGLYLYVLTVTGSGGSSLVQRGKFVIIR